MMKTLAAAIAAFTLGVASPALAATTVANVTIAGDWFQTVGTGNPFGLPDQPTLTATITLDSESANPFVGLDYVTGTKTWTIADIDLDASEVWFNEAGAAYYFSLHFLGPRNAILLGPAQLFDGENAIACNGCVTWTGLGAGPVPEPATWAMLIAGFGLAGAALRRGRYAANARLTPAAS